jgi:hypothetical protein
MVVSGLPVFPSLPRGFFHFGILKLETWILLGYVYLKVPKREIFDRSDFLDFYTIKSSWIGDLLVKILTYYYNF